MSIESTNEPVASVIRDGTPIPLPKWFVALLFSTMTAWFGYNFLPLRMELPSHLIGVNAMSPKDLQVEAAEKQGPLDQWNSCVTLAYVGMCFGAASLLLSPFKPGRVLVCIGVGGIAGCAASFLGLATKRYFNQDLPIPMVDYALRPMVVEIAIYCLLGTLLCIPLSLSFRMYGSTAQRKTSIGIVLAGIVSGGLFPVLLSVAFPTIKTDSFPPNGAILTSGWFSMIALVVFALSRSSNARVR